MRTHTPAPWLVRYERDENDSARSTIRIIDGSPASLTHPQGPVVIAKVTAKAGEPYGGEALANGDLMSAAPEMLEALRKAVQMLPPSLTLTLAQKAIEKAIGNTRFDEEQKMENNA